MSLLVKRDYYKPFSYSWAYEAFVTQSKMHWLPQEVPLHDDIADFNSKLSRGEKDLLTQLFRFFTQSDIDVAGGYIDTYLPWFKPPEVRMMLTTFAAMEAIHIQAYSMLIDQLGLPEIEYKRFQDYEEMRDKHEYIEGAGSVNDVEELLASLAIYSAFGEGLQLFSSFAILLNFSRFNKMKGMGQIVTYSIKDEDLHVTSMIKLFHTLLEEHPTLMSKRLIGIIQTSCRKMVDLEFRFIDLAFGGVELEGITKEEVQQFIMFIANKRLRQLGVAEIYEQQTNPLEWLDWMVNGAEHVNFFENRSTAYAKGSLTGNWDNVY